MFVIDTSACGNSSSWTTSKRGWINMATEGGSPLRSRVKLTNISFCALDFFLFQFLLVKLEYSVVFQFVCLNLLVALGSFYLIYFMVAALLAGAFRYVTTHETKPHLAFFHSSDRLKEFERVNFKKKLCRLITNCLTDRYSNSFNTGYRLVM